MVPRRRIDARREKHQTGQQRSDDEGQRQRGKNSTDFIGQTWNKIEKVLSNFIIPKIRNIFHGARKLSIDLLIDWSFDWLIVWLID